MTDDERPDQRDQPEDEEVPETRRTHLDPASVIVDDDISPRVRLNQARVKYFIQHYQEGSAIPPIRVVDDGQTLWLADGFHRVEAARAQPSPFTLPARIRSGTKRDAILWAMESNAENALPFTDHDIRRNVTRLLMDPEWCQRSDRAIAHITGSHKSTVNDLRRKLELEDLSVRVRTDNRIDSQRWVTRGGTSYSMQTGDIGKGRTRPTKRLVPWSDGLFLPQDFVDAVEAYAAQHAVSVRDLVRQGLEWRLTQGDPFSDAPGEA
jgi:hypothetical protein